MKQYVRLVIVIACVATVIPACAQSAQTEQQVEGRAASGETRQRTFRGTAGTITTISGNTITLKQAMNDAIVTVKLSDKTEFRKEREPAKLSDLKVGDFVIVRGERTSDSEIAADSVMSAPPGGGRFVFRQGPARQEGGVNMQANMADLGKTFIVGEVKAIEGAKITVHRPDDQDQTIEADENTSFRKAAESITLPDIKLGDTIMGRGELRNGVFVPSQLNVLDPSRVQIMRHRPSEQDKPAQAPPQ